MADLSKQLSLKARQFLCLDEIMLGLLLITSCFVPSFACPTRPAPCETCVYTVIHHSLGHHVTKLAGGLLFFLPFPLPCGSHYITLHYSTLLWGGLSLLYSTLLYLGAVFSLLYITLHYWRHYSLLYSACVHFMVAGGDLFVTPPLWHPASVAVRSLS